MAINAHINLQKIAKNIYIEKFLKLIIKNH